MYLDLDPERWPSDANICNHSVASCFLEGQEQEGEAESETDGNVGFGEEHNIDEIRDVRIKYPLIDDADSSQHSALIDAVDGKSLVIEGPPGTGKSQTITNLIAAAMAAGKKVLFVAEKLAALEVVYRRLDKVGLSSFCLELHSHKTQKRKLIDEVNNRLAKHGTYREPTEIELDIKRYEELKSSLNTYAENINRIWKNTGYTLHKILTAAARYRGIVKIDLNDISPDGYDGEFYNPEVQRRNTDKLEVYREIYQSVTEQLEDGNSLQSHPWYGVKNDDLQIFDLDKIVQPLAAWQASLQQLNLKIEALAQMMDGKPGDIATTMSQLIHFVNKLEALPHLQGNELLKCLPDLRGDVLEKSQQYLALTQEIQELYTTLGARIDTDFLSNPEATNQLLTGGNRIKEWVQPNISMAHLNQTVSELLLFQERMESVHTMQKKVSATLGEPLSKYLIASKPGLIEFKRIIEFVSSISPSHWKNRDPMFDNEELDELLPQLQSEINELKKLHDTVSRIFDLSQLPAEKEIRQAQSLLAKGGFFKLFKKDWRMARKQVLLYTINAKTRLSDLLPALLDLANLVAKKKLVEDNPHYRETLGNWLQGLDTDFDTLQAMRGWYREIRRQYGFGFEKKAPLGDALIGLPPDIAKAIRSLKEQNVQDQIDDLVDRLDRLQEIFSPAVELHADGLLVGEQGIIPHLIDGLREAVQACGSLAEEDNLTAKNIGEFVEQISYLQHKVEEWQEDDIGQTPLGRQFGLQIGTNVDNTTSVSSLVNTLMLATHLETQLGNRILLSHIHGNCNPPTFSNLKEHAKSLRAEISNQDSCQKIFEESAQLNHRQWTHQCGEHLGQLITRNQVALENHEMLEPWLGYVRERNQIEESGLNKLAEAVETNRVAVSQIHDAYEAGIFNLLAKEVLSENPDLERVNGRKQESLQKQFGEYDQQIIKRQCERIAWKIDQTEVPTGNRGVRVSEHTEKALLEHECGKQTRHIPIRQLLERAGQALIALKPCFMMGPMSVAQYLAPGKIDFDLIVMDEASQIKPQDALGAIARGGQLVVVGDPKQLPPTSFFDKLSEEDEDPTVLAESESILDTARLMFPSRRLRWHYRSQHESLIAFSNQSFYNNDLILFPSPKKDAKTHGIQFSPIPRGCFVNQRNMEEARIISEAIREHFIHYPEETLGVVAMNSKQREQIEQAVETLEKEDETFKRRLDEDRTRHESLFVKNLENVQGDERDVIFISMTYGPPEPGTRVFQRFGPINSDVGWRRLNVLFTRSRKRMHIFSSMRSKDILIGASSKRGVQALHDFLKYCETGILHETKRETGRAPDSDFEVAVIEALGDAGFECEPQVGVAGFFIDIAVIDPGYPSHYLMGIECDGATYHSAKSARDRDRLRQAMLERLGWKIRRIWSTDWFKNPKQTLQPIVKELRELASQQAKESATKSETEEIRDIIEQEDNNEAQIDSFAYGKTNLGKKLTRFDRDVIYRQFPHTPENKRLLRPAMLEALLENTPTSQVEFLETIPAYLREATEAEEETYLPQVFDIINASPLSSTETTDSEDIP